MGYKRTENYVKFVVIKLDRKGKKLEKNQGHFFNWQNSLHDLKYSMQIKCDRN